MKHLILLILFISTPIFSNDENRYKVLLCNGELDSQMRFGKKPEEIEFKKIKLTYNIKENEINFVSAENKDGAIFSFNPKGTKFEIKKVSLDDYVKIETEINNNYYKLDKGYYYTYFYDKSFNLRYMDERGTTTIDIDRFSGEVRHYINYELRTDQGELLMNKRSRFIGMCKNQEQKF